MVYMELRRENDMGVLINGAVHDIRVIYAYRSHRRESNGDPCFASGLRSNAGATRSYFPVNNSPTHGTGRH